jgi:ribonuclease P protein component
LLPNRLIEDKNISSIGTFPKSVRLRKRADFVKLSVSQKKVSVKGFLIVWQSNDYADPRLGVTVSKKVGSAVTRNRVKRLIREVFRLHRLNIPAVDINIIARKDSVLMDYSSVEIELKKAFSNIGATTCSKPHHC